MLNCISNRQGGTFFRLLFGKTLLPITVIFGVSLVYILLMSFLDHQAFPALILILVFASVKTLVISMTTLRQISKLVEICHSIERLLWIFGWLISISIFSFATDYTCLYQFEPTSFKGADDFSSSYIQNLFHFFYFSLITFSTVGYGDIAPLSWFAKFVVVLEIFLSFFIVVFAFANIKKIHL